ncbi:hypothetical protein [Vibrio gazogenes]|nr:hypothetical protein [Vibrio gazogenes]
MRVEEIGHMGPHQSEIVMRLSLGQKESVVSGLGQKRNNNVR